VEDMNSVARAVGASLDALWAHDMHLLEANTSERSLTHQLAVHLSDQFPHYQVDCEYNRDGFDVKRLALHERTEVSDDSVDAVTVFPDIIVHARGRSDRNLLVIEVKKASSGVSDSYDMLKLAAFKRDLGYVHAAHLRIGVRLDGVPITELKWI
jgi:hypothetical protein